MTDTDNLKAFSIFLPTFITCMLLKVNINFFDSSNFYIHVLLVLLGVFLNIAIVIKINKSKFIDINNDFGNLIHLLIKTILFIITSGSIYCCYGLYLHYCSSMFPILSHLPRVISSLLIGTTICTFYVMHQFNKALLVRLLNK